MGRLSELLERRDSTLWPEGNVASGSLGWLDLPDAPVEETESILALADSMDQSHVLYVGMGGSSLGAMMLCEYETSRGRTNGRSIRFVDSTHPNLIASLDATDALFVMGSKSGSTTEVNTIFDFIFQKCPKPDRYIVLTDADSSLEANARDRGIRRIVSTPANVGGRYSVLSPFGTVAAALLGMDIHLLLEGARSADLEDAEELALRLFESYTEGRDKLSVQVPPEIARTGMWLEQLIAESLGKSGKGIVPLVNDASPTAPDRVRVHIDPSSHPALGREILKWEAATALLGSLMQVDAFNQPDVTAAKRATGTILERHELVPSLSGTLDDALEWANSTLEEGDYLAIMGFLDPFKEAELYSYIEGVTKDMGTTARTFGLGPRFLHSTGQLHKGGPNKVVAIQIADTSKMENVPIPGQEYGFRDLLEAQAWGDYKSLTAKARRVMRVGMDIES